MELPKRTLRTKIYHWFLELRYREINKAFGDGCEAGALYKKELQEENERLYKELEAYKGKSELK